MVRRLEVAIELAKKDKVDFDVKMKDKKHRAEIELKRLRILEADKAKKGRVKELMDKATTAYAEGKYVESETYAKRAMEIDPNELAASMLAFKAKTERRYKTDLQIRADKEEGVVAAFQEVDLAPIADPEVQLNGIKYAQELQGPDPRAAGDERPARAQERPQDPGDRGQAQGADLAQRGQAAARRGVTFLQNYTGLNIVLDPKALGDEGLTSASPVTLNVNNDPAQDRPEAHAPARSG